MFAGGGFFFSFIVAVQQHPFRSLRLLRPIWALLKLQIRIYPYSESTLNTYVLFTAGIIIFRKGQTGIVQPQEVDGVVSDKIPEAVVSRVAAKSPAGVGTVVVDSAAVQSVMAFKENTACIVRMDHVYLSCVFVRFNDLL